MQITMHLPNAFASTLYQHLTNALNPTSELRIVAEAALNDLQKRGPQFFEGLLCVMRFHSTPVQIKTLALVLARRVINSHPGRSKAYKFDIHYYKYLGDQASPQLVNLITDLLAAWEKHAYPESSLLPSCLGVVIGEGAVLSGLGLKCWCVLIKTSKAIFRGKNRSQCCWLEGSIQSCRSQINSIFEQLVRNLKDTGKDRAGGQQEVVLRCDVVMRFINVCAKYLREQMLSVAYVIALLQILPRMELQSSRLGKRLFKNLCVLAKKNMLSPSESCLSLELVDSAATLSFCNGTHIAMTLFYYSFKSFMAQYRKSSDRDKEAYSRYMSDDYLTRVVRSTATLILHGGEVEARCTDILELLIAEYDTSKVWAVLLEQWIRPVFQAQLSISADSMPAYRILKALYRSLKQQINFPHLFRARLRGQLLSLLPSEIKLEVLALLAEFIKVDYLDDLSFLEELVQVLQQLVESNFDSIKLRYEALSCLSSLAYRRLNQPIARLLGQSVLVLLADSDQTYRITILSKFTEVIGYFRHQEFRTIQDSVLGLCEKEIDKQSLSISEGRAYTDLLRAFVKKRPACTQAKLICLCAQACNKKSLVEEFLCQSLLQLMAAVFRQANSRPPQLLSSDNRLHLKTIVDSFAELVWNCESMQRVGLEFMAEFSVFCLDWHIEQIDLLQRRFQYISQAYHCSGNDELIFQAIELLAVLFPQPSQRNLLFVLQNYVLVEEFEDKWHQYLRLAHRTTRMHHRVILLRVVPDPLYEPLLAKLLLRVLVGRPQDPFASLTNLSLLSCQPEECQVTKLASDFGRIQLQEKKKELALMLLSDCLARLLKARKLGLTRRWLMMDRLPFLSARLEQLIEADSLQFNIESLLAQAQLHQLQP